VGCIRIPCLGLIREELAGQGQEERGGGNLCSWTLPFGGGVHGLALLWTPELLLLCKGLFPWVPFPSLLHLDLEVITPWVQVPHYPVVPSIPTPAKRALCKETHLDLPCSSWDAD
jgi:hypothetical protein